MNIDKTELRSHRSDNEKAEKKHSDRNLLFGQRELSSSGKFDKSEKQAKHALDEIFKSDDSNENPAAILQFFP